MKGPASTLRGHSLIELMVASVIALIIVAAGTSLAAAMARSVRRAEEQGDLGARASIAHTFVTSSLSSAAYNWNVTQTTSGTRSGSYGQGACASSTGMCATTGPILPLEICSSTGVTASACPAPTATTPDALKTYLPRDGIIEAVSIVDRNGTALTDNCTATNVPNPVTFDVKGATSSAWEVSDLVLISRNGHSTIATVTSAFAANASATATRTLALDTGTGTNLANDDNNSASACSATTSLKGAKVMRIRQLVVKLDNATDPLNPKLQFARRDKGTDTLTFINLLSDIDDLGFQLDLAHLPLSGVASTCRSNTTAIFVGNTAVSGGGTCDGENLNGSDATADTLRVVGLRTGILLRTAVETQLADAATAGLFDSTRTFSDKRLRRTSLLYVGLPNASSF